MVIPAHFSITIFTTIQATGHLFGLTTMALITMVFIPAILATGDIMVLIMTHIGVIPITLTATIRTAITTTITIRTKSTEMRIFTEKAPETVV